MLHDFLTRERDTILTVAKKKALESRWARVSSDAVEEGWGVFYDDLTHILKNSKPDGTTKEEQTASIGDKKGKSYLRLGYAISEVVQSYAIIYQAISESAVKLGFDISKDEFRQLNLSLDSAIAEVVAEFESVQTETQLGKTAAQDRKAEAQDLKAEAQDRKAEAQDLKAEAQDRKAEAQDRKAEAQDRKAAAQDLKAEAQDRKTEAQDLKAEAQDRKTEAQDLKAEAQDRKTEAQDLKAAAQDLKAEAQDRKTEAQDLKAAAQDLKAEAQDRKTEAQDLKAEAQGLKAEAQDRKAAAQDLKTEAQDLKAAAQDLKAEAQDRKTEAQDLKAEAQDRKAAAQDLKAEAQDRKTEAQDLKAEAQDKRNTQRLGFLAHELRNSLQSATVTLEMIEAGIVEVESKTGLLLRSSLNRMSELIDTALAEARMRMEPVVDLQRVRILEVMSEVGLTAEFQARSRNIKLRIQGASDVEVLIDRHLFASALSNLIQNALKFSREGSTVQVRTRHGGNRILIEIEDECGGLPPGKIEELFSPGIQRDADRSGLGLGLAISKQAIERNKGELRVENLPGKGCIFIIDLPEAEPVASKKDRE